VPLLIALPWYFSLSLSPPHSFVMFYAFFLLCKSQVDVTLETRIETNPSFEHE
jgi:hypothetical protein